MDFPILSWESGEGFKVTTDRSKIDLNKLYKYLHYQAYWCKGIPREVMETSVNNSISFSVIDSTGEFQGFARVITDLATFAYLADVYVEPEAQGRGIGKFLISTIMNCVELQNLRTWLLLTIDAQGLYEQFGWKNFEDPRKPMRATTLKGGYD